MTKGRGTLAARGLMLALSFAGAVGEASATERSVTIGGPVEAVELDERNRALSVSILDDELGPVLVLDEAKGAELRGQVGADVTATGELRRLGEDADFLYAIRVTSFTVDRPAEDPDPRSD